MKASKPTKRTRLAEAQNWRCAYCSGLMIMHGVGPSLVTREHLVPVSKGGSDDHDNLVAACKACNETRDSDLSPELFHEYRTALVANGQWPAATAPSARIAEFIYALRRQMLGEAGRIARSTRKARRRRVDKIRAAHAREERWQGWGRE